MAVLAYARPGKKDRKNKKDLPMDDVEMESMETLVDQSFEFQKFAAQFNKNYRDVQDFEKANNNWRKSKKKVRALRKANKGKGVRFDDNWTSDLDDEQFKTMLGLDAQDLVPSD